MGPSLATVHVLVVDDSPAIRGLLSEMLECAGATVTAIDTAEHALELVEQLRPDVLLSDLEMPGKGGDWLIGQVRALPRDRGGLTPAACLTGRAGPEDRAHVLGAGFQYHIAKPVDMRRLLGIVGVLASHSTGGADQPTIATMTIATTPATPTPAPVSAPQAVSASIDTAMTDVTSRVLMMSRRRDS